MSADLQALLDVLEAHGFVQVGAGRGYVRFAWPSSDNSKTLVVATDPTAPEFDDMFDAVITELDRAEKIGVAAGGVIATLQAEGVLT